MLCFTFVCLCKIILKNTFSTLTNTDICAKDNKNVTKSNRREIYGLVRVGQKVSVVIMAIRLL